MSNESRTRRRRHSPEVKAQILAECERPGASVAGVAMAHGINANVVHRWRQRVREGGRRPTPLAPMTSTAVEGFVPVVVADMPMGPKSEAIRIELRRGATAMTISWPTQAAAECAGWLRELLR
jgi:transposase